MLEDPRCLAKVLAGVLDAVAGEIHEAGLSGRSYRVVVETGVHLEERNAGLLLLFKVRVGPREIDIYVRLHQNGKRNAILTLRFPKVMYLLMLAKLR